MTNFSNVLTINFKKNCFEINFSAPPPLRGKETNTFLSTLSYTLPDQKKKNKKN